MTAKVADSLPGLVIAPPAELVEHSPAELLRDAGRPDGGEPATGRIYRLLRGLIVNLRLLPNQLLSINEVAESLGVSKTPVREAFIRLAEDGLVVIVPKKGTFVAPIDIQKAFEGYFIRAALESACAAALAAKRDARAVEALSAELAEQERSIDAGDNDRFYVLDNRYHATMFEVAGMSRTRRLVDSAKAEVDRIKSLKSVYRFCRPERALLEEHAAVLDAIAAGDAEAARELTRRHLGGMNEAIQGIAKEERLWGLVKSVNRKGLSWTSGTV